MHALSTEARPQLIGQVKSIQVRLGITATLVVAADQVSKALAVAKLENGEPINVLGPVLKLSFARNPGAAFSFATSATLLFTVLAASACVGIIWFSRKIVSPPWAVVFGAILGGALGNLIDRVFRSPQNFQGHVVDFIELPNYPIFNLADSAIFCATIGGIILTMRAINITEKQSDDS